MEVLVQIVDQGTDIDNIKAGEVIAVQADGWGWTEAELTNPDWRIIQVPIINTTRATLLLDYMRSDLRVKGVKYPRKAYLLDTSLLPDPSLFTGARTQGIISLTNQQALAAVKKVA